MVNVSSLPITDFATAPVLTIGTEEDLDTAAARLAEHHISSLLVVGPGGTAAGVLSRRDLLEVGRVPGQASSDIAVALPGRAIADVMSFPVISVAPGATVEDAARLMCARGVHRVYVLDQERPVAVFSTRDAMAAVRASRLAQPIAEFMSPAVTTLDHAATIGQALGALERDDVSAIVITEHGLAVGVFGEADALAHRDLAIDTPLDGLFNTSLLQLPGRVPLFRAAAFTLSTEARRIVVLDPVHHTPRGLVTGLDFCRALAGEPPRRESQIAASGE